MISEQEQSETSKIEEFIMDKDNLKKQDYGSILRALCNRMSLKGINNFIHYRNNRIVELFDPPREMAVIVDFKQHGILLKEQ